MLFYLGYYDLYHPHATKFKFWWIAAVAQWIKALAPEGWVFESQPRQT